MKPQLLKNGFRMAAEHFQLPERVFRLQNLHQFHLVKLVDADHAAVDAAGASGFPAEAGRVLGHLDGQVAFL